MQHPLRWACVFIVMISPLVWLTGSAFFSNADPSESWEPPAPVEIPTVPDGSTSTAIIDPAGFSSDADRLKTVYQLAQAMSTVDAALIGNDLVVSAADRDGLGRVLKSSSAEIEQLEPSGVTLVAEAKSRLSLITRHGMWLDNRKDVAQVIGKAEQAFVEGPERVGEKKVLELINALLSRFPKTVATDDIKNTEPSDALTEPEHAQAVFLRSRALFRHEFFELRQASSNEDTTLADTQGIISRWDDFIEKYTVENIPDTQDAHMLDEVESLRLIVQLLNLQKQSENASKRQDSMLFFAAVKEWQKVADESPKYVLKEKEKIITVIKQWLDKTVPALDKMPNFQVGTQEGYTSLPKRFVGRFVPVPGGGQLFDFQPLGQDCQFNQEARQFSLIKGPAQPRHVMFWEDYTKVRDQFVSAQKAGLELKPQIADDFSESCAKLAEEFSEYQATWGQNWTGGAPPNCLDDAAKDWSTIFSDASELAQEISEALETFGIAIHESL